MINVILVDKHDAEIGIAEKIKAHQEGWLHRAFSVFIYRKKGENLELLLQQRHLSKYHSGGLWTNTCCGHPYPRENILEAGQRRLQEEMGFMASLKALGVFHYTAEVGQGLIENEIDHVLIGEFPPHGKIAPDPQEISDVQWAEVRSLRENILKAPEKYTFWLPKALAFVSHYLQEKERGPFS
jgi:isopentenyl-diphosphate delta-isomerase type 1